MPGFDGTGPTGQGTMTGGGRGRGGRGRGGQRQGMGPVKECRCPNMNCGYTQPHQPGQPCANQTCPKCGTRMIGI